MENSTATFASNGNTEKLYAMAQLGFGTLICGLVPLRFGKICRGCPLVISLLLCFGAGILLATALVHMLPDVRKNFPDYAEITLCGGFFIIYFIDEFIHFFFGEVMHHSYENEAHQTTQQLPIYGATNNTESQPLLPQNESPCPAEHVNAQVCHTNHTEPCSGSLTGIIGLLVALSLHAFIEGLAIGVQDTREKVIFLVGAVSAHKLVIAFCLSLEFCSQIKATFKSLLIIISVFALGTVLGIAVGMGITNLPSQLTKEALPILQALASGTLLYVTVSEVLPREKAKWHQVPNRRIAGLLQFLAVASGFATMTIIDYYLDDKSAN